ncbi:MAG: EAL domain-containing protein [Solirubrobacteraceae bacterium]|nr:EAL domain-containing protein [Solirubrobacteraceae bacterium]
MEAPHSLVRAVREALPRGHRLPPDLWYARHRAMVAVLRLHIPVLFAWGLLAGYPLPHSFADIVPLLAPAWLAGRSELTRRAREICTAIGLLTASAIVVHLMDGAVEGHFHFFVMVSLLALYEEWFPYLLAFAFVLVHHIVMSALSSAAVFDHADAIAHPFKWSAIHALFIAAQGTVCVVAWKVNEDARARAEESRKRFGSAFSDAPIAMALVELDGTIRQVNGELSRRWADAVESGRSIVGRQLSTLVYAPDLDGRAFPGDEPMELRNGDESGWGAWHHAPLRDADGLQTGWISHCIDISKRRKLEADLTWGAEHDPLTGLPNRRQLGRAVDDLIAKGDGLALLFVDVDDFKLINDSLGHEVGDALLRVLAERLESLVGPMGGIAARFGGDEFVIVVPGRPELALVDELADRVGDVIAAPIQLAGDARYVRCSVGVRCAEPGEPVSTDALVRDADLAMYRAKDAGKGGAARFDEGLRQDAVRRLAIESSLRDVIERDELSLVYQPLVDLGSGRVGGVEALLRWTHPEHGFVSPVDFIPLAEQNGAIVEIGEWVLDQACMQMKAWDRPGLKVSVNVSSRQLTEPGFVATVEAAIARHEIDANCLCLEVTETAVLGDAEATRATLEALSGLGLQLAVDDFGVGYASLMHLRKLLPLHTLKVDKSFVDGVLEGAEDAAIVAGVIRLAHSLGLDVVAEGVEQAEQAEQLRAWGCEVGQGYHFSRPVPPHAIDELLASEDADLRQAA